MTDTALRLRQHSPASLADGGDADEGGEEAVFNFPLMAKHRDAFVAAVFEVAAARARFEQASTSLWARSLANCYRGFR